MIANPVISIVGAGALGGYYGARLAQHGHDVHFLLRSDFEAVMKEGWTVKSCDGDFSLRPGEFKAYADAREMPKSDLVLVTLKTTANGQFDRLIRPLVKEDTVILTLQNGLGNEEQLAGLFGREKVMGGMAFACINRLSPGVIHHMAEGWIRLGEFGGGPSPRASRVAELFTSSKVECKVLDDLRRGRWEKLSWNIPFNGLGAALDYTTDRIVGTPVGIEMARALIAETLAAARAIGVALSDDLLTRQIDKTRPMGPYQTSMQVDRRAGRPMEVEAILGEPLRLGTAAGARMPNLESLYKLVKVVDAWNVAAGR